MMNTDSTHLDSESTLQQLAQPTKHRVIESMSKYSPLGLTIRVWRSEAELKSRYSHNDIVKLIDRLSDNRSTPLHTYAQEIAKLPRINAVEVLDYDGHGVLIYPEWP